jgi:hypothetical protein
VSRRGTTLEKKNSVDSQEEEKMRTVEGTRPEFCELAYKAHNQRREELYMLMKKANTFQVYIRSACLKKELQF